jgi:hypothetical protein
MLVQWLDYRLDNIGFESWEEQQNLISSKSCRLALRPTQLPIQLVPCIFTRCKVAGHYVNHTLHLVTRLRILRVTPQLPQYAFMVWTGTTAPLLHLLIYIKRLNENFLQLHEYDSYTVAPQVYCVMKWICFPILNVFKISPYYLNMTNFNH